MPIGFESLPGEKSPAEKGQAPKEQEKQLPVPEQTVSFTDLVAQEAPKVQLKQLKELEEKDISYGWAQAIVKNRGTQDDPDYAVIIALNNPKKTAFMYEFGNNYQLIMKFLETAEKTAKQIANLEENRKTGYKDLQLLNEAIKLSLEKQINEQQQ